MLSVASHLQASRRLARSVRRLPFRRPDHGGRSNFASSSCTVPLVLNSAPGATPWWSRWWPLASFSAVAEKLEVPDVLDARSSRHPAGGGKPVTVGSLYHLLKRCTATKDAAGGRAAHALAVRSGYEANAFLGNHIIRMYAAAGELAAADQVFRRLPSPDVFVWASIISAHAELGQPEQGARLYRQMRQSGRVNPNAHVFVAALKACAGAGDVATGRMVHSDVVVASASSEAGGGGEWNAYVGSSLVNMYAKCGRLEEARQVFDASASAGLRDVVTWNAMITAYTECGHGEAALELYGRMRREWGDGGGGVRPDEVTLVGVLKACGSVGAAAIQEGRRVHEDILRGREMEWDVVVGSALVDMYCKCGDAAAARRVFDRMPAKNVVTWSAMIAGYAERPGLGEAALALYARVAADPDLAAAATHVTLVGALKACASVGAVDAGRAVHAHALQREMEGFSAVGAALVDLYAKCGRLGDARRVVERLPPAARRDAVVWNALIHGCARHGDCAGAARGFDDMMAHGAAPDAASFLGVLAACARAGWERRARDVVRRMAEDHGVAPGVEHYTCLVDLLCRLGRVDEALWTLLLLAQHAGEPDAAAWTAVLAGCRAHGRVELGRACFDRLVGRAPGGGAAAAPPAASAYALMAGLYADAGMWESAEAVEAMRRRAGAQKKPAEAVVEVRGRVHRFVVGAARSDTSAKLRSLLGAPGGGEGGDLCGHAEKLAIAFGLLNTPQGAPLLVTKNLRMCGDCHRGSKVVSRVERREIVVRDARTVHRFSNGSCSCEGEGEGDGDGEGGGAPDDW